MLRPIAFTAALLFAAAPVAAAEPVAVLTLGEGTVLVNQGEEFISATNGQAVTITTLGGVNTNVSGLSAGSKYYVDSAGALTTSSVSGVEAGKALSATSLLVTGG